MKSYWWTIAFCFGTAAASAQAPDNNPFDGAAERGGAAAAIGERDPGAPAPNAIFAAIDTDGDGVITTRELRRAVAALKKMDVDRDGNITLEEVQAYGNSIGIGPPGEAGVGSAGFDMRGGAQGGFGPGGFRGRDGVEQQQMAERIRQYDRNGDGKLSPEEVPPQMRGMLRGGDRNGDGTIDAEELQVITQRMSERFRGGRPLPEGFPRPGAGQVPNGNR